MAIFFIYNTQGWKFWRALPSWGSCYLSVQPGLSALGEQVDDGDVGYNDDDDNSGSSEGDDNGDDDDDNWMMTCRLATYGDRF